MSDLLFFHFLRPFWLLALIPLAILTIQFLQKKTSVTGLDHVIDADLLPFLTVQQQQKQSIRLPIILSSIVTAIVIVALAGPTWKKLPQAVFQSNSALIIALDLSPSMRAEDNTPSRIRRAQLKIQALLDRRKEGLTALLVYAGEAHTVTPFTDDTNTISNLLTTLTPGLLPIPGSNTEMAVQLATEQLTNSGLSKSSLLLVTDGVDESAINTIKNQWDERLSLTILGLGTESGATIPSSEGYLRDSRGEFILAKRNSEVLETLASATGGYYLPLQADDSDIAFIERVIERDFSSVKNNAAQQQTQDYDQWYEFGPILILIILPFFALLFRRGWLLSICLTSSFILLATPHTAHASLWESLWKNKDQRGHKAWQAENYEAAENLFNNKQWKGSAAYNNDNFNAALEAFKQDTTASGYFNQGNALAHLGQVDEAIEAYEKALTLKPDFKAAEDNKRYLQDQQEEQQKQQNNQQQAENQNATDGESDNDKQEQSSQDSDSTQDNNDTQSNNAEQSEQNPETQDQSAQQANNEEQNENEDKSNTEPSGEIPLPDDLTQEEQQAMQQWLRKIPDDPSGLLRRKFEYEFNKRRQLYQQGKWNLPENNAHQRY